MILLPATFFLNGCQSAASGGDAGVTLFRLGSGSYVVTGTISPAVDGCGSNEFKVGDRYSLVVDNTTGNASLSAANVSTMCSATFGCGVISQNQGVLKSDFPASPGCAPHKTVETSLALTGDSRFDLRVTEMQSNRCNDQAPDPCTSIFNVTLGPVTLGPE